MITPSYIAIDALKYHVQMQRMLDSVWECIFRTYRSITDSICIHLPYNYIAIDAPKHHVRTQRMLDAVWECTFRTYQSITDSIRIHLL